MMITLAPMEGVTIAPMRNALNECFGGVDRYYAPFLTTNMHLCFKKHELRDVNPENNRGIDLVPQILSKEADQFVWGVRELEKLGYKEVNLNLGCPSPTVVTKGKGSGMLRDQDALDAFFEKVFEGLEGEDVKISVKTRIGLHSNEETEGLIRIYNRYPITELIVHPRLGMQGYKGVPDMDAFRIAYNESVHPVGYNGDICTVDDAKKITEEFPDLTQLMIGRGMSAYPALAQDIRAGIQGGITPEYAVKLERYMKSVYAGYAAFVKEDNNIMMRMKELWAWMWPLFPENKKAVKTLLKSKKKQDYDAAQEAIFDILKNAST